MPFPAPAHDEPPRWINLLVLTAGDVLPIDVDAVAPSGSRIELGADAHPFDEAGTVRQIGKDDLRRCLDSLGDLEGAGEVLNHGGASWRGLLARPGSLAGRHAPSTSAAARPPAVRG